MYLVIEIQAMSDTQVATLVDSYSDQKLAEQKYHLILSAASVSSIPVHSAIMLMEDGHLIKKEAYYHQLEPIIPAQEEVIESEEEPQEPEPEPEEEP